MVCTFGVLIQMETFVQGGWPRKYTNSCLFEVIDYWFSICVVDWLDALAEQMQRTMVLCLFISGTISPGEPINCCSWTVCHVQTWHYFTVLNLVQQSIQSFNAIAQLCVGIDWNSALLQVYPYNDIPPFCKPLPRLFSSSERTKASPSSNE